MDMAGLPDWAQGLVIKAIKDLVPPSVVHDLEMHLKIQAVAWLAAEAHKTENRIDDACVALVAAGLGVPAPQ